MGDVPNPAVDAGSGEGCTAGGPMQPSLGNVSISNAVLDRLSAPALCAGARDGNIAGADRVLWIGEAPRRKDSTS